MYLVIKTYLKTRMQDGTMKTWLSMDRPCETEQGPNGYQNVEHLRRELRDRNKDHHVVEDIENGLKLTPMHGLGHAYAWQEVTLRD